MRLLESWRQLAQQCPPPSRCRRDARRHRTASELPLPPSPRYRRTSRLGADADDATMPPCCLAGHCRRASAVTATATLLPPPRYRRRHAIAAAPYHNSYLHDNQYLQQQQCKIQLACAMISSTRACVWDKLQLHTKIRMMRHQIYKKTSKSAEK